MSEKENLIQLLKSSNKEDILLALLLNTELCKEIIRTSRQFYTKEQAGHVYTHTMKLGEERNNKLSIVILEDRFVFKPQIFIGILNKNFTLSAYLKSLVIYGTA